MFYTVPDLVYMLLIYRVSQDNLFYICNFTFICWYILWACQFVTDYFTFEIELNVKCKIIYFTFEIQM